MDVQSSVTERLKPSAHAAFWEATPAPSSLIDMTPDLTDWTFTTEDWVNFKANGLHRYI